MGAPHAMTGGDAFPLGRAPGRHLRIVRHGFRVTSPFMENGARTLELAVAFSTPVHRTEAPRRTST